MNDLGPRELSNLWSILDFFRKHPLCTGDFFAGEEFVNEDYSAVINAAFPNADENPISVVEVTRHKVTLLGFEIIRSGRLLDVFYDQVGYIDGVVVKLPDGSRFEVMHPEDLAELRVMSKLPPEQWIAKDGEEPVKVKSACDVTTRKLDPALEQILGDGVER